MDNQKDDSYYRLNMDLAQKIYNTPIWKQSMLESIKKTFILV